MAASRVDLHSHTTASDGELSPARLVALAARSALRVLAVTDHDTFEGLDAAEASARRAGISFVPGVELTAYFRGHEVHLLAYFPERRASPLSRALARFRERRVERMRRMIARLSTAGIRVGEAEVIRPGMGAVGRPHLAQALVRLGHARDVSDAFARLIGQRSPAYVRKYRLSMERALRLVHESGGVSVMAHPGRSTADEVLEELRQLGLQGIEAYHSDHDAETTRRYLSLARRLGFLVTGGSDFHGERVKPGVALGSVRVPLRVYESLRAFHEKAIRRQGRRGGACVTSS